MKTIPLLLMGCGGVGRQLLQHIVSCRSLHAKLGVYLRVVGVCDSKSLIVVSDELSMELDDEFLLEVCRVKLNGSSLLTLCNSGQFQALTNSGSTRKVIDIAAVLGKSLGLALVDCSASSETIGVLKQVVDLGCCIVLANKKPLTSTMEDYEKLVSHPRRIRHESTVGAGLPVIVSINRVISSGDAVHRIVGSLSGTLGYVMSEVQDGKPLSQVVKVAKSLGFTEPDPRDDLSGMDVARKALILARLLGWRINLDSIKIESLFPKEMGANAMSVEDFLDSGLLLLDKDIQERVTNASLNGNVLRYVCVIEGSRFYFLSMDHPNAGAKLGWQEFFFWGGGGLLWRRTILFLPSTSRSGSSLGDSTLTLLVISKATICPGPSTTHWRASLRLITSKCLVRKRNTHRNNGYPRFISLTNGILGKTNIIWRSRDAIMDNSEEAEMHLWITRKQRTV